MKTPRPFTAIVSVCALVVGVSTPLPAGLSATPTRLDLGRVIEAPESESSPTEPRSVLLVALDGVRPIDVFEGPEDGRGAAPEPPEALTPHLHRLMAKGLVLGRPGGPRPMRASGPNFMSLPGYTEMLTGAPAPCQDNDCEERPAATVVDVVRASGAAHDDVGVVTSWPRIGHVAASAEGLAFVSTGRVHVEELEDPASREATRDALDRGRASGPAPGSGDYRPDENTIEVALAYVDARRPAFLFVSLGDTDEHAHDGDYAAYLEALRRGDAFVGELAARAEQWTREGHPTAIVVTTDHGRASDFFNHGRDYPDSAAVWLVAAGPGIARTGGVDGLGVQGDATLSDVATIVTRVAGLPRVRATATTAR